MSNIIILKARLAFYKSFLLLKNNKFELTVHNSAKRFH